MVRWTNGPNSFVVVAMIEAEGFGFKEELLSLLTNNVGSLNKENKGAAIVLERVGGGAVAPEEVRRKEKRQGGGGP